jgi:hypothetical protein
LFNLADDVGEKKNLAEERPELRDRLLKKLHAWRESLDARMPTFRALDDPLRP